MQLMQGTMYHMSLHFLSTLLDWKWNEIHYNNKPLVIAHETKQGEQRAEGEKQKRECM